MVVESWVFVTVIAAFFQNLRSALQKHSANNLSLLGASYVRFLFAFPFAIIYLVGLNSLASYPSPVFNGKFFFYCLSGGIAQIFFTILLISLFGSRNFAVGTVYSKTEIIQVALLAFLILGEPLSGHALIAICLTLFGVLLLTVSNQMLSWRTLLAEADGRSTFVGLASGSALGSSVVFYRGAALSLEYDGPLFVAAAYTLVVALVIQSLAMGIWIFLKERATFGLIKEYWKSSLAVGVAGILASIAWFTAFTMHNVAEVRALGQLELVFTFLFSVFIFREKTNLSEFGGIFFIMIGVMTLILLG